MKTRNFVTMILLLVTAFSLTFTSCKKDKNSDPADSSSLQQLSRDEEDMEQAMDESMNDVDQLLAEGNLKSTTLRPCNANIDSVSIVNDTLTIIISYHGLNCRGTIYRRGIVEIKKHVGTQWHQTGATVMVRHINFNIKRIRTQRTITLNGVKVHTNVSGGLIWQLGSGINSIVHRTRGHVTVKFPDSTFKTWSVARQKTYTGNPPENLILTIDGFGDEGTYNNLLVWGINRHGEQFYTQILQPVVHRQVCDWDPVSGIKKHTIPADSKSATMTFGYDSNNQPVTGGECPTKFRLDWQRHNQSGTVYLWL